MISNEKSNTLSPPRFFSSKKIAFSVAVLVIFHLVGFWGLVFSGNKTYFQNLTPLNLLLTNFLLFASHKNFNGAFFGFVLLTFLTGFFAEVIGVHTGLLFGEYAYGQALGPKLWNVPLLIGLNWVMLVYAIGIFARSLLKNPLVAAFAGALLMVALDVFIEPVAMQYDFWSWQNNQIPVWNYICWLGVALLLQLYFQHSRVDKSNPMANAVFFTQALFFIALNLFL